LLLGSNIEPEANLRRAVALLCRRVEVVAVSPVFESRPVGTADQPCYLNAVAVVETSMGPGRLRADVLRPVEAALGRVRTADKFGPRTMDVDLVMYGDRAMVCGGRRLPDRGLTAHAHVALPMAAVAPDVRHPETGETMREIAARLLSDGVALREDIAIEPPVWNDKEPDAPTRS
jgi:2-amino-4-hydroxy-6-hydroxymethyldihydropteridine diphosphokinase